MPLTLDTHCTVCGKPRVIPYRYLFSNIKNICEDCDTTPIQSAVDTAHKKRKQILQTLYPTYLYLNVNTLKVEFICPNHQHQQQVYTQHKLLGCIKCFNETPKDAILLIQLDYSKQFLVIATLHHLHYTKPRSKRNQTDEQRSKEAMFLPTKETIPTIKYLAKHPNPQNVIENIPPNLTLDQTLNYLKELT